nr:integrase, catalytic region, zinc finger, CCHC-type, peptidase aspartic, catalytic [Tanacetum cinerariifolium]
MLIFSKALMFLWAEALATADDLGKLQPTADTGIFIGYAPRRKGTGPAPNFLTPGQISSGLVPNTVLATPFAPHTNKELEILFQLMYDEYLEPPRTERSVLLAQAEPAPVNSAGTPLSNTIDQDAYGQKLVFGALCYPTNDNEDLGKLQLTADTGIFVGYAPSRKGYRIYNKRTRHKLRPCTKSGSCNSLCTPTNKELEILFQPMFDEYLDPSRADRPGSPAQAVQAPVTSAGTPLSTTIDQDAPSPHISLSSSALQSNSLPPGVASEPHFMKDHNVAPIDNNPFIAGFKPCKMRFTDLIDFKCGN